MSTRVCLAATCHDPSGAFSDGVAKTGSVLRSVFSAVAINATLETSTDTVTALATEHPDAHLKRHQAGSIGIGAARRQALALALRADCTHIFYSDLDHVLRWAMADPGGLNRTVSRPPDQDFTVIGRSASTFDAEPWRLRATESVVNHIATMALNHADETWDLMIATRLMTRTTAELLVAECVEDSIANDVIWPLHVASRGRTVGYAAVDGLDYRFRDDFAATRDDRDNDILEWIKRVEIAARHASAMRHYAS